MLAQRVLSRTACTLLALASGALRLQVCTSAPGAKPFFPLSFWPGNPVKDRALSLSSLLLSLLYGSTLTFFLLSVLVYSVLWQGEAWGTGSASACRVSLGEREGTLYFFNLGSSQVRA